MRSPEFVPFDPADPAVVTKAMTALAEAKGGWINLWPDVDPDDVPKEGGTFRIFGTQGPPVPLCTWTPWDDKQRGTPRVTLGVQHGTRVKAMPYLAQHGVTVDPRWRVLQDHPRRGLVVVAPVDDPAPTVLGWLVEVGAALCDLPYHRWAATIYRPR